MLSPPNVQTIPGTRERIPRFLIRNFLSTKYLPAGETYLQSGISVGSKPKNDIKWSYMRGTEPLRTLCG